MTIHLKPLGSSAPAATTATTLYTCPASTETVISGVWVCNRQNQSTTFRIWHDVGGAGDSNDDYICYDVQIEANETIRVCEGVILNATDLLRVYSGSGNLTFKAYGQENT